MKTKPYEIDETKCLSDTELESLEAVLSPLVSSGHRDALMIALALKTGARASELLAITKKDLNPTKRTVFIRGLKNSKNRSIPLHDDLYKSLQDYADSIDGDQIFKVGYRMFDKIWKKFGVDKKLHSLRHTFAINLYKRCRDIQIVKTALGHRNIDNTMVYLDFVRSDEELRGAIVG